MTDPLPPITDEMRERLKTPLMDILMQSAADMIIRSCEPNGDPAGIEYWLNKPETPPMTDTSPTVDATAKKARTPLTLTRPLSPFQVAAEVDALYETIAVLKAEVIKLSLKVAKLSTPTEPKDESSDRTQHRGRNVPTPVKRSTGGAGPRSVPVETDDQSGGDA